MPEADFGALRALEIVRFRGLRNLRMEGLGRLNLLVGPNNVGKTSILEALWVSGDPLSPGRWVEGARRRLGPGHELLLRDSFEWLFHHEGPLVDWEVDVLLHERGGAPMPAWRGATQRVHADVTRFQRVGAGPDGPSEVEDWDVRLLETRAGDAGGFAERSCTFAMHLDETGRYTPSALARPTYFLSSDAHRMETELLHFLSVVQDDPSAYSAVNELLGRLFPDVERLYISAKDVLIGGKFQRRTWVKYQQRGRNGTPLGVGGDGLRRAATLACALYAARGGVLLIDEVETGLHHSLLQHVLHWMRESAERLDVQVIATTHDDEAILRAVRGTETDQVVVWTLRRRGTALRVGRFSSSEARTFVEDAGGELRG